MPCGGAASRAATPSFYLAPVKQQPGKKWGWNCSSEEDHSDQDPFSFSRMGTSVFPAPAAWTALVISCFQTEQAWMTNPGCKLNLAVHKGSERGEGGDLLPGEMKTCSAKESNESSTVRTTTGHLSRTKNIPESPLLQQYWVTGKGKSIKYTWAKPLCRYKRKQNTHTAKGTTCSPGNAQHLIQKYPKFLK